MIYFISLFALVFRSFSMSFFTRTAASGLCVTATLTFNFTSASASFRSGWLQCKHKLVKKEGKKVWLETRVFVDGEVIGEGQGLWIVVGPVPKM